MCQMIHLDQRVHLYLLGEAVPPGADSVDKSAFLGKGRGDGVDRHERGGGSMAPCLIPPWFWLGKGMGSCSILHPGHATTCPFRLSHFAALCLFLC